MPTNKKRSGIQNAGYPEPASPTRRLFRYPFVFTGQFFTTGNGTLINGGALQAGESRQFPLDPFGNQLTRPAIVKRIKFTVTRVAGGDEIDSDYDNVLARVRDLVRNEDLTKDPVALSALCDRERREWIFHPGELILRSQGGGLNIQMQALPGAIGAPFNISVAVHAYTEELAEPSLGMAPEER